MITVKLFILYQELTGDVFIVFIKIEFIFLSDRIVDFPIFVSCAAYNYKYLWEEFCVYLVFEHQMNFLFCVVYCSQVYLFVLWILGYFPSRKICGSLILNDLR